MIKARRDGATPARTPGPRGGVRRLQRSGCAHRPDAWTSTPVRVLVLRNAGPIGGPGFPEWGQAADPESSWQGVRDMVRISDARMSGTSYGAAYCTLRPKRVGGPLALVQTATRSSSMFDRKLNLVVSPTNWHAAAPGTARAALRARLRARFSRSTSRRPMRAAISTFLKASPRFPSRKFTRGGRHESRIALPDARAAAVGASRQARYPNKPIRSSCRMRRAAPRTSSRARSARC